MFDGMSKPTLLVATLIGGLALFVAGFIIAMEIRSAVASPAAATTGGGCYTNWNADTCASGYTAVETGVWTDVMGGTGTVSEGAVVCASKHTLDIDLGWYLNADTDGGDMSSAPDGSVVRDWPCAICCASGGAAVGGVGQLPNVAGTGDPLPRNQIIIAAVTAMIAFGAGGWYARRRWGR